ncbi:MAG TPA: LytTR family DNA-binding domain-containing protein [Williamwhitmania sp.]|nr:LytTR family DNA-binding domain-containing protein [Williamwhitmania sp.]
MLKTIIIDDEVMAREAIGNMVTLYCPNLELTATADGVATGYEAIKKHNPDLVLLDIKLTDGTGFDLLQMFESINFKFIFITAYEEYAIQAFKFSALDYLLKPIDPNDLIASVEKLNESIHKEDENLKLKAFMANIQGVTPELKKIVLKTAESIHLVNVKDIIRCESSSNYTLFFFTDNTKLLVSKTLKEFDEMLSPYGFFRAHQSHLINLNFLDRYDKAEGGTLILKDKSSIPLAVRKREQLMKIFENL